MPEKTSTTHGLAIFRPKRAWVTLTKRRLQRLQATRLNRTSSSLMRTPVLIEATDTPIRYRLHTGEEVLLKPGVPTELTDHAGRQLLKKAGNKVRLVPVDHTGHIVTWDSPLFGLLSATVLEDFSHGVRVVHPLTEVE